MICSAGTLNKLLSIYSGIFHICENKDPNNICLIGLLQELKEIIHDKYITKTNCVITICSMQLFNMKILDNVYYKEKGLGRPF